MILKKFIFVYPGLLLAMLCWGLTFIWYKQAYPAVSPIALVTLRLLIAVVLLFIIVKVAKRLDPIKAKDIPEFLLLAFFEPLVYFLGESYGLKYVSSTLASLIIATIPLITPFAAHYFFKEKLSKGNYLGIIISVIGVALIIQTDQGNYGSTPLGVSLMMLAVVSTIGFSVYVKKLSPKYNTLTIVFYQNLFGLLFFIPLFLFIDKSSLFKSAVPLSNILPVVYLAVFGSIVAFVLFINSIRYIGIARANVFTNTIPVFTAILSFFILREEFDMKKITGIIIVMAGLFLSQVRNIVRFFKRNDHGDNTTTAR
ncbi:MAG: DMT family transporter [Bacteroidales bacterium]|nr:DMT family transporter [Bacteroidales bacterium]